MEALEDLDLMDHTMVVFTSDNPMPHKNRATDMGARVPLVIHCPALIPEAFVSEELISLADICPSLIDLAGVKGPDNWNIDGKSFLPYLREAKLKHTGNGFIAM